jgi:hypothetical protein
LVCEFQHVSTTGCASADGFIQLLRLTGPGIVTVVVVFDVRHLAAPRFGFLVRRRDVRRVSVEDACSAA